jgi:hypothetical protein
MQNQTTKIILVLATIATLSSCGNSKSAGNNQNAITAASIAMNSQKPLTNCTKSMNSDISMNANAVLSSSGQVDMNWVKIKFNYLSAAATASGNTIRFFKWKVTGSQSFLDQTALSTQFYDLSSGQPTTNLNNITNASDITGARGLYVQLNDPTGAYQVIKAVVYNSDGQIVAQLNSLIPQFASRTTDYALNSDGTPRAQILTSMHPLAATVTTAWTQTDYANYFQNFCF